MLRYFALLATLAVSASSFVVPSVDIVVYRPRGFRVSVRHVDGVQLFAFHANVNRNISRFEAGQYFFESRTPVNCNWTYHEKNALVEKGDTIHFWIYFQHNRLGYVKSDGEFKVTELITDPFPEESRYPLPPSELAGAVPEASESFAPPVVEGNAQYQTCVTNLTTCERTVLKITHKLVEIDNNIEKLKETNTVLKNIIERLPDGRKLTLSGRISREDNPISVVQFILNEKLNLRPNILSALRNSDLSITFELSNVDELVDVITEAKTKLANSKVITISY